MINPQLLSLAATQGGVFSARQARQVGITADELDRARRHGSVHSLRRGIFTVASELEEIDVRGRHRLDIAGAVLLRNEHRRGNPCAERLFAAGARSAGLMWRLPCPPPPARASGPVTAGFTGQPTTPTARVVELVSHGRGGRTYRFGVSESPATLPAHHVVGVEGIPVTTRARTAADLMRGLGWEQAVFVADAALNAGLPRAELEQVVGFMSTWPGGRRAVRACRFADGAAESAAESLARLVIAELGLPTPELQVEICHRGVLVGRVDFLFREQRVILEVDGRIKYIDPHGPPGEVLWREKQREDRLRDAGYEVVRVTWAQLNEARAEFGIRVRAAFSRAYQRAV